MRIPNANEGVILLTAKMSQRPHDIELALEQVKQLPNVTENLKNGTCTPLTHVSWTSISSTSLPSK
jgi:hypothetical protein